MWELEVIEKVETMIAKRSLRAKTDKELRVYRILYNARVV